MDLLALIFSLLIFVFLYYLKFCWNRLKMYRTLKKLPGQKKFWIPGLEGIIMAIKFAGKNNQEIFELLLKNTKEFKSPSILWLLNKCIVITDNPNDIQIFLNSPNSLEKSDIQKTLPTPLGMVSADVEIWRPHRRYLNPAFKPSVLKSLHPITNQKAKKFVDYLSKHLDNQNEFNILPAMLRCTLEALLETMLGMKRDLVSDENNRFLHLCHISQKYLGQKLVKIWLHYKPILRLTKWYKFEQETMFGKGGIFEIADEILAENQHRRSYFRKSNAEDDDGFEFESTSKQTLIDYFIANELNWPRQELKDEINTTLAAGFDTSALTLSGALLMLAMHQDVQQKVVEELREVFSSVDEEVTEEHLKALKYSERVLFETMRLFPVLPMLTRRTTGDVKLENVTIPAGVEVLLPIYNAHRNVEYWGEDAHLFRPERFAPEEFSKVRQYAFTPFSQGQRMCIGMRYGMNVMKILMAHILRNYKLSTSLNYDDIEFELELTIKVKQNYMLKLEKRNF